MARIKVVGIVVKKPSIVIGRGVGCKLRVEVLNDIEAKFCDIIVTKGRKPWKVRVGDMVEAVGTLRGDELLADAFWKFTRRVGRY